MKKLLLLFLLLTSCSVQSIHSNPHLKKYQFATEKMGTQLVLTFFDKNKMSAQKKSELVFKRIDALELIFSDYIENSEANRLAASAGSQQKIIVSDDMWNVLTFAHQVSEQTNGAFDVTIGALSKLWRKAFRQQIFPKKEDILAIQPTVNYKHILYDPTEQAVTLIQKGTRLDFGGIAKGYAMDQAMLILTQQNIQSAMIYFGGEILVSAAPPNKKGWNIAIEGNHDIQLITNQALATSGKSYKFIRFEGKKYSHIIDPRTGYGVAHNVQTTVFAKDGMTADALASATNVLNQVIDWTDTKTFLTILDEDFPSEE